MLDIWLYQTCNGSITIHEKLEKRKFERRPAERL
jgi:hypothetical protein